MAQDQFDQDVVDQDMMMQGDMGMQDGYGA